MRKWLAIPVIVMALAAINGCSGDRGGNTGAGSGGASAGSGGAGSDGTGGALGREAGVEVSPGTAADGPRDLAGDGLASICASYVPGSDSLPGISAQGFGAEFEPVCGRYDPDGTAVKNYQEADPQSKACRAGHLCNAKAGDPEAHCRHAAGLSICD